MAPPKFTWKRLQSSGVSILQRRAWDEPVLSPAYWVQLLFPETQQCTGSKYIHEMRMWCHAGGWLFDEAAVALMRTIRWKRSAGVYRHLFSTWGFVRPSEDTARRINSIASLTPNNYKQMNRRCSSPTCFPVWIKHDHCLAGSVCEIPKKMSCLHL